MKNLKILLTGILMTLSLLVFGQDADDYDLMAEAMEAKAALIKENAAIKNYFTDSEAYAIFPSVNKGAFIIGGASGNGVLYENGAPTGLANMKKVSVGLQAGGKSVIEVIFFENEQALNEFKNGEFKIGSGVSAVFVMEGVELRPAYKDGILVFALPKAGVMADASVSGQRFTYQSFNESDTK